MSQSVDGLSIIANKAPVVGTHIGGFNATTIEQTEQRYRMEALTYVRPKDISAFQQYFLERLRSNKTSIGCIVAPFGYGKTSAAIDTWRVCSENGILAVLPFSCSSVAEMGKAIATGIEYQLGQNTAAARRVHKAYEAYLVSSAKRLAEQDVAHYQISLETALRSIEDKIERGYLQIDATGSHLLGFLEQLTSIVVDAGYKGLLIIVDEFQQFLGNINKAVITNFRTLVWGLRTRGSLPLGLMITMDPDTERNLAERAGDILHRIKEDSLYLDFTLAYDRGFARLLWAKYAETFHFDGKKSKIVDLPTLDAIGQICERHDLSNGPRTVIDLFQRIARLYAKRRRSYTPIDLIDDFLTGEIRFDGDRSKIASLVTELTSYEYIKMSHSRLQALKLISAFPRGCSSNIAELYGLAQAFSELSDSLRGEVLTELPEGMALIDLQRVGKPQNKLNILLKKYWMQITEDEIVAEHAAILFAQHVISPLFQPYGNVLSGWNTAETSYQLTPSGSYLQVYEGSFFEEYPRRRVCIEVCRHKHQISSANHSYDVRLVFVLQQSSEATLQSSFDGKNRTFTLAVKIDCPFGIPMPRDVRWIEDYLRPVVMSPAVVLSLVEYIDTQAPAIDEITENELQRIRTYSKKLNEFLISVILGPELFAGVGFEVVSRGEAAIRHVLFHFLHQAYPDYQTLITSPQWEGLCRNYVGALSRSSPIHTRGLESLAAEKSKIATLFGLRNHAGFESHIRQYRGLVALESWTGNQGVVRFERHGGEDLLLKAIALHKGFNERALAEEARKFGYLSQETAYLLEFLLLRGFVEKQKNGVFRPAKSLSELELRKILMETENEATEMASLVESPELRNLMSRRRVKGKRDLENAEAQVRVLQFRRAIEDLRPEIIKSLENRLIQARGGLYQNSELLRNTIPTSATGLPIDAHINGAQRSIAAKSKGVLRDLEKLTADMNKVLGLLAKHDFSTSTVSLINRNQALQGEINRVEQDLQDLVQLINRQVAWIDLANQLLLINEYLQVLKVRFGAKSFASRYNSLCRKLTEGLSVKGLNAYDSLYEQYRPQVQKLLDEISVAIRAKALDSTPLQLATPLEADGTKTKAALLRILHGKEMKVREVLQKSGLSAEQVIAALIQLESQGQITLTVRAQNRK